jgi:hypothetical protein
MGLMLDSLQRALAQEIAKRGKDAPFARDLRAQISSIERQQRQAAGTDMLPKMLPNTLVR